MKVLIWGSVSAVLFLSIWTAAHAFHTTMPEGFSRMQPMGLISAGFFWGCVVYMIRERIGGKRARSH